ncbi:MAG: Crp/Fnr family transcriptional regulator [Acidobacteria bacterium]|nr:Crp/Fnr family transcriptional regulator [Acidobacteriota bacterium]
MVKHQTRVNPPKQRPFDIRAFLESGGVAGKVVTRQSGDVVYSQGEPCDSVFYIQKGTVKLGVLSHEGKEAIVAMAGPADFFGEGALAGQVLRMATATATSVSSLLVVEKQKMLRLLHDQHELSDRFLAYVLSRNIRVEADLVDQLFNSSERRLARTLLLLARYGKQDAPHRVLPKISQEMLAEMVGTTRSRVNFFMNKFRKLGFIEYNGGLKVNDSLLSIVLHD